MSNVTVENITDSQRDEAYWICRDCGIQFLSDQQKEKSIITTAHQGECDLCEKQEKMLIPKRHYNYLHKPK